jgi:hypothetical protein
MISRSPNPAAPIKVQTSRRGRTQVTPVAIWSIETLQKNNDPLSKIVVQMLHQGANAALLLSISPQSGTAYPIFEAKVGIGADEKVAIWSGLRWDSGQTSNLWALLNGHGLMDLMPQDTNPTIQALRSAFGARSDEHLFLVRLGTSSACNGVLACISKHSLVGELTALKPTFTTLKSA